MDAKRNRQTPASDPVHQKAFFKQPGIIGVTGHRLDRLTPQHEAHLVDICRELFAEVDPDCALLSCLAEGTDTILAEQWPQDRTLLGLLPTDVAGWRAHISHVLAPARFDALVTRARVACLEQTPPIDWSALAGALVARSDRILAVWDGEVGKPGGTGSVVRQALREVKPVLHLKYEVDGFSWGSRA
ncbi:MAG: hypothetical protein AAGM12_01125 [Pseudomonadota bacterium]